MSPTLDPRLVNLAIAEAPAVIALLRAAFQKRDPSAPAPTDAEVIAAYQQAFVSSLAKDDAWLTAHPAGSTGE
jgi:hypothetical protein